MPALATLIVVLHVGSVFWLVSGIVGRATCQRRARRTNELAALIAVADLSEIFELRMVRPAGFFVLATGLTAAALRGWPILGFLQGGQSNWVLTALGIYLTMIPVIALVYIPRSLAYHAALDHARSGSAITPALRAAIEDPLVAAARVYEMLVLGSITWLMIAKPF